MYTHFIFSVSSLYFDGLSEFMPEMNYKVDLSKRDGITFFHLLSSVSQHTEID